MQKNKTKQKNRLWVPRLVRLERCYSIIQQFDLQIHEESSWQMPVWHVVPSKSMKYVLQVEASFLRLCWCKELHVPEEVTVIEPIRIIVNRNIMVNWEHHFAYFSMIFDGFDIAAPAAASVPFSQSLSKSMPQLLFWCHLSYFSTLSHVAMETQQVTISHGVQSPLLASHRGKTFSS